MMPTIALLLAACTSASAPQTAPAASATPVAAAANTPIVLRAARMIDVKSGRAIDKPEIVVRGKTIERVGTGVTTPPQGAEIIDLGQLTLMPGLIDVHTHLSGSIEGDFVNRPVHEGAADSALRGAKHARTTLLAGFTTVRDLGSEDFVDIALMRAVERGDIDGPWIFPAGHPIGITGGHADVTGFRPGILEQTPDEGIADGPDACVKAVRTQIKYGAKVIKCMATAGVLSFDATVGAQQLSFEELKAIVDEATRHGLKVASHAHGTEGIIAAVKAGVASIEHGSMLSDEAIDLMLQHGTYLVPTAYLRERIDLDHLPPHLRQKAETVFPRAEESLKKAVARGVKIACGTDAAVYPHGENAHELATYVKAGMKPADALRTATVNAVDLLGVQDRGVLEAGKLADIIAVPGNPLDDVAVLQHVQWVMHGGRVVR
jgi:imidazolonepropionase-like amidohydrolase